MEEKKDKKKVFKGRNRFKTMMEWEQKNPEFKVSQFECHNGKITAFYKYKDCGEDEGDE